MQSEQKKINISVDENDILKISEKIQKNIAEDKAFSESFDKYLSNKEKTTAPLVVSSTPNALAISGANPNLNIVITPRTIAKCMAEADERYHGHGLSEEIIKQLPMQLRNPTMIFKGNKDNSLVAITELKDKEEREIMIAVSLSETKGFGEVNRIASVYGRNNMNNYLQKQMEQGNLVAINKEKAERMLHSAGLQLPLENTFFSFDNSIAYSDKNVNRKAKIFNEENLSSEHISHKLLPILNMKYRYHINQINNFKMKKSECLNKIDYRQNKIDKLTLKVQRLESINNKLKASSKLSIFSGLINSYIKSNEEKIKEINTVRIPKHQRKIDIQKQKIKALDHKIAVKQCKADRLVGLSNIIKSFTIIRREKRQNLFIDGMEKLNDANKRSLDFKLEKCDKRIANLQDKYDYAKTEEEKTYVSQQLSDLSDRKSELTNKRNNLNKDVSFKEQSTETIDKLIDNTEQKINELSEADNISIPELANNISINGINFVSEKEQNQEIDAKANYELNNNTTVVENTQEPSEQIDKDTILEKSESTPRKDYDKINPEFYQSLKSKDRYTKKMSDDIADKTMNDLNSQGIECSAVRYPKNITGITVHKDNKEIFDKAMNLNFREYTESKSKNKSNFIGIAHNPEFYKSLPKENRFINELTAEDGQRFIDSLTEAKCEFSYRAKDNQKIAITIDNRDSKAIDVFNNFINTIDKSTYMDNIIDILRDKGFAEISDELLENVSMQLTQLSGLEFGNEAMSTFVNNISPEYTVSQISEIKNITKEIFEQNELDRMQDPNNLYKKLADTKADFDLDVSLKQVFSQGYYNDEQKTVIKDAVQNGILAKELSSNIDDSYTPDEIKQFTDVYKTYDVKKIQSFLSSHDKTVLENAMTADDFISAVVSKLTNDTVDNNSNIEIKDNVDKFFTDVISNKEDIGFSMEMTNPFHHDFCNNENIRNYVYDRVTSLVEENLKLEQIFLRVNYNSEQKDALKEAVQLNIPIDDLSSMIDSSFSADEIKKFSEIYKTYDNDKIQKFLTAHNDKKNNISNKQQKEQFTMSRRSLKEQAERVNKEHSNKAKEKVPEPSLS